MKQMAFLQYSFLFDTVDTWQHLSQFEDDLASFFADHGLQAQIVKTVSGQQGARILIVQKVQPAMPEPPKAPKPGDIQKQINKLRGGK